MKTNAVYDKVFILGSGFSKSFCPSLPTLKDLSASLPDKISNEFPALKNYCEHFLKLCNGDRSYMDIETIASAILSSSIFSSEAKRLSHLILRFELLRFISSRIQIQEKLPKKNISILENFLKWAANDSKSLYSKNLLLSFNYDLLLENVIQENPLLAAAMKIDYGLHIDSADRKPEKTQNLKTIDLIKLHGSLDWFPLKGSDSELEIKNICHVQKEDKSYPIYNEDTPVFIPMANSKESFLKGTLFNVLWAKADYYLKTAREIYCIGYGFPKSDINNLEFLLKHKSRIKKVVVFENENHPDILRIRHLFKDNVVENADAKIFLEQFLNKNKK